MSPVFNEGRHPGEFILSEAAGKRSRETVTISAGAGVVAPGTVLGLATSGDDTGEYLPRDVTATDGTETASAVCIYGGDATSAAIEVASLVRDAEVNHNILTYVVDSDAAAEKASANAELATAGIIAR
ncbi:MAG: head decoration protein [Loktanella sp.]|nr:head decoration protein [Loktanella sp.]